MSRGLGRVEKQVLRTLDMNPGKWVRLTGPGTGRSRASSVRRAAHSLASKGLVELKKTYRDGTVRLSARRATDTRILPDDLDSLVFSQVGVSVFVRYFFRFWAWACRPGVVLLVLGFAEHEGLADAVALSGEFDESSVVDDAVDNRGGEFVIGEDRAPFAELDVRGGG